MSVSISYEEVDKTFPGRVPVRALRDISFDIRPGELFCLLGPSGCGKTTLLRATAGLEQVSSGRIRYDGADVTNLPPFRRQIGMVFQSYALYPHMTVFENVAYGLRVRRAERTAVEEKVRRIMDLVGLPEVLERNPSPVALSGGQQQRVAVARALVYDPKILLLDEPLANLDAKLRRRMRAEIRRIQKQTNITTVFVTHDQEEAMAIGDRLAVMRDGVVEQIGSAEELYRLPASLSVAGFIGTMNFFPATVEAVRNGRATVVPVATGTAVEATVRSLGEAGLAVGSSAILGFRPEQLSVHQGPDRGRLETRVEVIQHLGQVVRYQLVHHDGEATQRFEVDMKQRLEGAGEGDKAYLQLDDRSGLAFPEGSQDQ
jgi:iron(III) transport system ATP-binding protein